MTACSLFLPSCQFGTLKWKLCLAQWSLHRTIFYKKLSTLDFPLYAKEKCGLNGVEYVNEFFFDKAKDQKYLSELKQRTSDIGVKNLVIMVDLEGDLGHPEAKIRQNVVNNHKKWVEAAKFLGCHSIRVNGYGSGTPEEHSQQLSDGLRQLSEFAQDFDIQIVVENHGGLTSNGEWLADVLKKVNMQNCGSLPDFGNFGKFDPYKGTEALMPFVKNSISAKSYNFDKNGNETKIDYLRMLKIAKKFSYNGYIGIEYEGKKLSELEGILATKRLIKKTAEKLGISIIPS